MINHSDHNETPLRLPADRERAKSRRRSLRRPPDKAGTVGMGLLLVQCAACSAVILAVLAVRFLGGDTFDRIRIYFTAAMQDNAIGSAFAAFWDDSIPMTTTTAATAATATTTATAATTATTTTATATTPTAPTTAAMGGAGSELSSVIPAHVSSDTWSWPVAACDPLPDGTITSPFGLRENPIDGGTEFHTGLDIAAPAETPISAMWFGTVAAVDESDGFGRYVKIYHGNGLTILYAHCSEILVEAGEQVEAGDIVASVGKTGRATGNHLHIEAWINGLLYDPAAAVPDVYG